MIVFNIVNMTNAILGILFLVHPWHQGNIDKYVPWDSIYHISLLGLGSVSRKKAIPRDSIDPFALQAEAMDKP